VRKEEIPGVGEDKAFQEEKYELRNEDIIREANKGTTMSGFIEHLEIINGGPLKIDA